MAAGVKTGGRTKGVPNKVTIAKAKAIEESGLTPLDYMLSVLRNEDAAINERLDAAKAAAPYVHSKMPTALEHSGKDGGNLVIEAIRRVIVDGDSSKDA